MRRASSDGPPRPRFKRSRPRLTPWLARLALLALTAFLGQDLFYRYRPAPPPTQRPAAAIAILPISDNEGEPNNQLRCQTCTPPIYSERILHGRELDRASFPFPPGPLLVFPERGPADPFADGAPCSSGCRAEAVVPGWPLKPFHQQHPLRAGFNERRQTSFHVGIDIQARDGAGVYAIQPGRVRILAASGDDARLQVGNFIYWHIRPTVSEGQEVTPYRERLGTVMRHYGHLHLSELDSQGRFINPLRPGGRALTPWRDNRPPVMGKVAIHPDGSSEIHAFDPQSFRRRTSYYTPVIAPAALAWSLDKGPLQWAVRNSQHLDWSLFPRIFAYGAHSAGFTCFATRRICRPDWRYRLSGGQAPLLPSDATIGPHLLTVWAWDWAGNVVALSLKLNKDNSGWRQTAQSRKHQAADRERVSPRQQRLRA